MDEGKYPHLVCSPSFRGADGVDVQFRWYINRYGEQSAVKNVFIRGSVVRYVHLPANAVDTALLEDATRRGMEGRIKFRCTRI